MITINSPNVLDLFSGAGGFSYGFQSAGFNILCAIENIKKFAETHSNNFKNCKTLNYDIRKLKPSDINIDNKSIDIIIGGPPCQTFSTIGSAKIRSIQGDNKKDPRNYLFKNFFEFVEYFHPECFVMENVPNIQTKYNGILFNRILDIIDHLNYKIFYKILNSVNYGVPQTRKRIIIVGTKNKNFIFPKPTHSSGEFKQSLLEYSLKKERNVYDAISDLPIINDGCRDDVLKYSKFENITEYQRDMRNKNGFVSNNICRVSNENAKKIFQFMKQGDKYMDLEPNIRAILPFREDIFRDRLKRLIYKKPSWTILAHIGMDGYMYIHPTQNRTLSVREAARIQSFKDSFIFYGNMREQYIQVGNAIPPLMATEIAKQVLRAI